ncbi:MAG: acyltransferase [Magnetococcales bacterium]|nr:acyltransferase [Magnetococcales bacterium]
MKYKEEIDGLRAVAVLAVILFHAGIEFFQGGYVGVDIFFVISGFLITSIIVNDLDAGCFTFSYFYERRVRRILPALIFMIIGCLPLAWLIMLPKEIAEFLKSVISSILFSSNILFWQTNGYFATSLEKTPLLHTWSLSVEEQYYLLFPLAFTFLYNKTKKNLNILLIAAAIVSLGIAEWGWRNSSVANFYLIPSRIWEFVVGSFVALYSINNAKYVRAISTVRDSMLAFAGMFLIVLSILFFDSATPFPSIYAIIPVAGTVLIILFAKPGTLIHWALSRRIIVGIGLISYSAYLWHYPLFSFARIALIEELDEFVISGLILLTLAISYFSWLVIERPFRNNDKVSRKQLTKWGATSTVFLIGLCVYGYNSDGFQSLFLNDGSKFLLEYKGKQASLPFYKLECDYYNNNQLKKHCLYPEKNDTQEKPITLIWGDSHAQALAIGLRHKFSDKHFFAQTATSSCLIGIEKKKVETIPDYDVKSGLAIKPACEKNNATAYYFLKENNVDTVIFAMNSHHNKVDWHAVLSFVESAGVRRAFIVGPTPHWSDLPAAYAAYLNDPLLSIDKYLKNSKIDENHVMSLEVEQYSMDVKLISIIRLMCSTYMSCNYRVPEVKKNDFLISWDYGHLSYSGSVYIASELFSSYYAESL